MGFGAKPRLIMLLDTAIVAVSLALIAKGGDLFVDSSVYIARALHIPRFIVGGTLVSLATTTPELVVSATASTLGDSGIALGNAVGSCICNIGLIVGTVGLMTSVSVDRRDFSNRAVWMSAAGALVVVFSLDRTMSRPLGTVLLALAIAYLYWDYRAIRRIRGERIKMAAEAAREGIEGEAEADEGQLLRAVLLFALGAVLIIIGSRLLVSSGQDLASALGIPSAIIGFSVIAIGTSLPELVTGVAAARKGVPDLSLGNIIGANVLNLLLIVGLSSVIEPLSLDAFTQWYAFPWLGVFFVSIIVLIRRNGVVERRAGAGLLVLYLLYVFGLIVLPAMGLA